MLIVNSSDLHCLSPCINGSGRGRGSRQWICDPNEGTYVDRWAGSTVTPSKRSSGIVLIQIYTPNLISA